MEDAEETEEADENMDGVGEDARVDVLEECSCELWRCCLVLGVRMETRIKA